jgi:hypothetical protein
MASTAATALPTVSYQFEIAIAIALSLAKSTAAAGLHMVCTWPPNPSYRHHHFPDKPMRFLRLPLPTANCFSLGFMYLALHATRTMYL